MKESIFYCVLHSSQKRWKKTPLETTEKKSFVTRVDKLSSETHVNTTNDVMAPTAPNKDSTHPTYVMIFKANLLAFDSWKIK